LANLVKDSIAPLLVPVIETVLVDNKLLLVAKVYPAGLRPSGFDQLPNHRD
jgi:hypothetical protein